MKDKKRRKLMQKALNHSSKVVKRLSQVEAGWILQDEARMVRDKIEGDLEMMHEEAEHGTRRR